MSVLSENWNQLTPGEKREIRFNRLKDSVKSIKFVSPEAKQHYSLSLKRLIDVYNVRKPDRIPVSVVPGVLPLLQDGIDYSIALHNPQKVKRQSKN